MTDSIHTRERNVTHLRDAIDRGATGSKVPYSDPAAAPLGTDEEAAGTPPSAEAVRRAYLHETGNSAAHAPDAHDATAGVGLPQRSGAKGRWIAIIGVLVAASVLAAVLV